MKRNSKRIVVCAIAASIATVGLASITYSFLKYNSEENVDINTGKIKVNTSLDSLKTYSADATLTEGDVVPGGENLGVHSGTYYYKELTGGLFSNGGSAKINDGRLEIKKMTPGDKVSFKLNITNESNVSVKYRTVFESDDTSIDSIKLFSTLNINVFDSDLTGCVRYATDWAVLEPITQSLSTSVDVALPLDALSYSDTNCSIKFTVEAIQANLIAENEEPTFVDFSDEVVEKLDADTFKDMIIGGEKVFVTLDFNNNTIKALTEGGQKIEITEGEVLTLKVENAPTGNIVVDNGFGAVGYEIGVFTANGDKIVSSSEDILVNILVGGNQLISKVYHNGVEVSPSNYSYDSTSGYITISCSSFSPFIVVSKTCNHTEGFNSQVETTCPDCLSTQNVLINDGVTAKFEQSNTGYFSVSYGGIPVDGFSWVDALNDTLVFTDYAGSVKKTGGFKTLNLIAGKSYVAHIKVTNMGEAELAYEAVLDTLSISSEIAKYLEISLSEIVGAFGSYTPTSNVLAPGKSQVDRVTITVSDDLPSELSGLTISKLPLKVTAQSNK